MVRIDFLTIRVRFCNFDFLLLLKEIFNITTPESLYRAVLRPVSTKSFGETFFCLLFFKLFSALRQAIKQTKNTTANARSRNRALGDKLSFYYFNLLLNNFFFISKSL